MLEKYAHLIGQEFYKITLLDVYRSLETKKVMGKCICSCGKELNVVLSNLTSGNTKSCGCTRGKKARYDLTGMTYTRWTVLNRIEDPKDRHTKWLCRCSCGTERVVYQDNLTLGKTSSCGCFSKEVTAEVNFIDRLNQQFGKLTVIERLPNRVDGHPGRRVVWKVRCECGTELEIVSSDLHERTSCGCDRKTNIDDKTGQRFGKLVVVDQAPTPKPGYVMWNCICDCGGKIAVRATNLQSKNTQSCGCLDDRVNTKPVSKQQRTIAEMVGGDLNYKVGKMFIDIVLLDKNIGIEYDSHYWHSMNADYDQKKTSILLESGWKVLRIKSDWKVPTEESLKQALKELETKNYFELVLDDWISREQKYGQTYSPRT